MPEQKAIKCPFCEQANIACLYTPRIWVTKYSRSAAAGRKAMNYPTPEKWDILTDKCPSCGKTKKEIEKRLKEGKPPSKEEILKRAQEAGLPLRF